MLQNGNMLSEQNNQITNIIQTLEQTSETAQMTAVKLREQDQKIQNIAATVNLYLTHRTKTFKRKTEEQKGRWTPSTGESTKTS